jgi:hypothetical protein
MLPPLHVASLMGQINIIPWLLEQADVDSTCELVGVVGKWTH